MDDVRANYSTKWSHERTAVVVDAAVQFGLTRIYQELVSELPIAFHIFRDFEDAVRWLMREGRGHADK